MLVLEYTMIWCGGCSGKCYCEVILKDGSGKQRIYGEKQCGEVMVKISVVKLW